MWPHERNSKSSAAFVDSSHRPSRTLPPLLVQANRLAISFSNNLRFITSSVRHTNLVAKYQVMVK